MPKIATEMSALVVARLTKEGDHIVGGVPGLLLRIAGNSRVWVLRVVVDAKRRSIGIGPFPAVTLAQAREAAREKRAAIDRGEVDGLTKREVRRVAVVAAAKSILFRDAAKAMILAKQVEWSNHKHAQQWSNTLATYADPFIGALPVADITTADIMRVLDPIWYTKPETASRVRGRIESAIDYAIVKHHLAMDNPARWKGHLEVLLPAKGKVRAVKHHRAIAWQEAPAAVAKIAGAKGIAARAMLFGLLTGARFQEFTGLLPGEIDVARGLWMIPASRMKMGKAHTVPLSTQALSVLAGLLDGPADRLVFCIDKKTITPLSDQGLSKVMVRAGIDCTTHGWRSTFRDWGGEATDYPNELLEMALAHAIENKAEAAYRRGEMIERRRPLMQAWADYVLPPIC